METTRKVCQSARNWLSHQDLLNDKFLLRKLGHHTPEERVESKPQLYLVTPYSSIYGL